MAFEQIWGYNEMGQDLGQEELDFDPNFIFADQPWKHVLFDCIEKKMYDFLPIICGHPKIDVNSFDKDGHTVLWKACLDRDVECIKHLLSLTDYSTSLEFLQVNLAQLLNNKKNCFHLCVELSFEDGALLMLEALKRGQISKFDAGGKILNQAIDLHTFINLPK